jgi:predicted dehydrogenase
MVHPRGWRSFMAYGNGTIGDIGIHMLDMVRWLLDLGMPKRITSTGNRLDRSAKVDIPDTQTATFDYGDLQVVWNHRRYGVPDDPRYPWGATLHGDKGRLKAGVMGFDFVPHDGSPALREDVKYELDLFPEDRNEAELEKHVAPALRAHLRNFLDCVKTRSRPVADIEQGYLSTAACLLANVSMQLEGRTLEWDAAAGRVRGDDEANALLRRPYRAPWVHPEA